MIVSVLMSAALLASCGRKREVDCAELTDVFKAHVAFSEVLTEIDSSNAAKLLNLNPNDYSELTMYAGTRSTADEFVIVKTTGTESVQSKLLSYVQQQKTEYMAYRPGEAEKFNNALIEETDGAVVMVVCASPDNASEVLKGYLKNKY
jgi:hypothetical protein